MKFYSYIECRVYTLGRIIFASAGEHAKMARSWAFDKVQGVLRLTYLGEDVLEANVH